MKRLIFSILFSLTLSFSVFAETGTLTADGDTSAVGPLVRPHVHVSGTFGSGTITFYFKDSNGGWRAISGAAFTASDDVVLDFERPVMIKGTLSGSSGASLVWSID